jgi:twitching motility protein PilI
MTADTQTLREFQEALFERLRNASAEDPARSSRLAFEAGGRSWLMRLDDAQEVVGVAPVTVIPLARPWYRGWSCLPNDFDCLLPCWSIE